MNYETIEPFLNETTEINFTYKYSKPLLYINYIEYCYNNKINNPLKKSDFNKFIESKFGIPFRSNGIYYRGFKIKTAPELSINI